MNSLYSWARKAPAFFALRVTDTAEGSVSRAAFKVSMDILYSNLSSLLCILCE